MWVRHLENTYGVKGRYGVGVIVVGTWVAFDEAE